LVSGGLAFRRWRVSRSRYAALLTWVAAATATGAIVITARIVAAVDGAGADVRVLGSLDPVPLRPETLPEDVTYLKENGTALVLSVFRPRAAPRGALAPILFNVHGGGYVVATPSIDRFAKVAAARGVPVRLVHFPYGDHGFAAPPNGLGSQAYRQLTVNWFREHGLAP